MESSIGYKAKVFAATAKQSCVHLCESHELHLHSQAQDRFNRPLLSHRRSARPVELG